LTASISLCALKTKPPTPIWWVAKGGTAPVTSDRFFNITHLFTKAGGGGTGLPQNYADLRVSGRDASGNFIVNIYLPRIIANSATINSVYSSAAPTLTLPSPSFNCGQADGYFIVFLAATAPNAADATAVRCSDGTAPPLGQANAISVPGFPTGAGGAAVARTQLGQFSQYPTGFPVTQAVAYSIPNTYPFGWSSTPLAATAPWYNQAPNLQGQLVLVPSV
jgi:hypothetical protein